MRKLFYILILFCFGMHFATIEADEKTKAKNIETEKKQLAEKFKETKKSDKEAFWKIYDFVEIADEYVQLGEQENAIEVLETAKLTAEKVTPKSLGGDDTCKPRSFAMVAIAYAKTGKKEEALSLLEKSLETANAISAPGVSKDMALVSIVKAYSEIGDVEKALKTLRGIKGASYRGNALAAVASHYALKGKCNKTLEFINQITNTYYQREALGEVFKACGKNPERSLQMSRKLEKHYYQYNALMHTAKAYAIAGEYEKALKIAREIPENNKQRKISIYEIASAAGSAGAYDFSIDLLSRNKSISSGAILCKIAENCLKTNEFKKAQKAINIIQDESRKTQGLLMIAEKYCEMGNYQKAFETAERINDAYAPAKVKILLTINNLKSNNKETSQVLSRTYQEIEKVETPAGKVKTLLAAADECIELKLAKMIPNLMLRAITEAKKIYDPFYQTKALLMIADKYFKGGYTENAISALSEAQTSAKNIKELFFRGMALKEISEKYKNFGQKQQASQIISEAAETLITALKGKVPEGEPAEWSEIAEQLGEIGPIAKNAVPILIKGLKKTDGYPEYQPPYYAERALKEIGKAAIPALIKSLGDSNNKLTNIDKNNLISVLKKLTGKNYGSNVRKWESWWDANKNHILNKK